MHLDTRSDASCTKARLLRSAQEVFLEEGIARSTLESISRRAGLTRGAFYFHFRNKEALIRELLETTRLPFQRYLATYERFKLDAMPLEAIRLACRAGLEELDIDSNRRAHRIFILNGSHCEGVDIHAFHLHSSGQLRQALLDGFQRAAKRQQLSPAVSPGSAAGIMQNLLTGLYRHWLMTRPTSPIKEEGMHMVETMLFLMRTPDAYPCPTVPSPSLKEEQS
ncbi:MAG TPA: TetR family transcriptional regulator, partial [Pseudomonas sp.]|nr:TetR family transcriptional regulator [Pseudomonas sp.]